MIKCLIPAEQDNYSAMPSATAAIAIELDGGAPRVRRDKLGSAYTITVQWSVGPDDFNYLMAFWRTGTAEGSLPFLIDLLIDEAETGEYQATFVPGTFKLYSKSGLTYVLQASLSVIPNAIVEADDQILLARNS